jgi:hypothetical protein
MHQAYTKKQRTSQKSVSVREQTYLTIQAVLDEPWDNGPGQALFLSDAHALNFVGELTTRFFVFTPCHLENIFVRESIKHHNAPSAIANLLIGANEALTTSRHVWRYTLLQVSKHSQIGFSTRILNLQYDADEKG